MITAHPNATYVETIAGEKISFSDYLLNVHAIEGFLLIHYLYYKNLYDLNNISKLFNVP